MQSPVEQDDLFIETTVMNENRKRTVIGLGISQPHDDEPVPKRIQLDAVSEKQDDDLQALCQALRSLTTHRQFKFSTTDQEAEPFLLEALYITYKTVRNRKDLTLYQCSALENVCQTYKKIMNYLSGVSQEDTRTLLDFYASVLPEGSVFRLDKFLMLPFFIVEGEVPDPTISRNASERATVSAWDAKYIGETHNALWARITNMCRRAQKERNYAKYCSIIQSSGMGKSRLVDEVSKAHFMISLCLRGDDTGFPPSDTDVLHFLREKEKEDEVNARIQAFLTALFLCTADWIKANLPSKDVEIKDVASRFRTFMTKGQAFGSRTQDRIGFLDSVIRRARQLEGQTSHPNPARTKKLPASPDLMIEWNVGYPSLNTPSEKITLLDATKQLIAILLAFPSGTSITNANQPIVLLSFDEAHTLHASVEPTDTGPRSDTLAPPSYFFCLRRQLRKLLDQRIFSLFLSTLGTTFEFTPVKEAEASERIAKGDLTLMAPFTDLGLDWFASPVDDSEMKIEDIACLEFQVKLGRPLFATRFNNLSDVNKETILDFAAQKLLGIESWRHVHFVIPKHEDAILACLSCRLGLDFQPLTQVRKRQMTHIERHMRICKTISPDFYAIDTAAPSEPILAEAARMIMHSKKFDPASALANEFRRPDVEKGPRGEALMKLLLTLASDMVTLSNRGYAWKLVDFLEQLITPSSFNICDAIPSRVHPKNKYKINSTTPLKKAFRKAKMYFNHWIKLSSFRLVTRDFLWRMIVRGAAAECPNNQAGIDLLIPFVYLDETLGEYTVSAILIQVKNDRSFSRAPQAHLFDSMDPYDLKIFSRNDKDYKHGGLPIIRIVAALASAISGVTNFIYDSPLNSRVGTNEKKKKPAKPAKPAYTAYDFWCAGIDPGKVWGPIREDQINSWRDLLDCWQPDGRVYKGLDKCSEDNRRSQEPGKYLDASHWKRFTDMSKYETPSK